MKKAPSINIIFEKDESGNPSVNSLLRQDILSYYREVIVPNKLSNFTFYQLIGWIIDYNKEISNYYKDPSTRNIPKRNRIADRWNRIKARVDEFEALELIKDVGVVKTRGGTAILYEFTDFAKIVMLVIELNALKDKKKKQEIIELIYHLICESFSRDQSSSDKYSLSIFQQLWTGKFFVFYLLAFTKSLGLEPVFADKDSLRIPADKDYETLKIKAFSQLEDGEKKIFLYSYKIVTEGLFYVNSRNLKGFEQTAYTIRGIAEKLTVEGFCRNCNLYFPLVVRTIEYFSIPGYYSEHVQHVPSVGCRIHSSSVYTDRRNHLYRLTSNKSH